MSPPARKTSVTMADVAVRAGVSRALVSLVVRDSSLVSDARRAAVLAAIDELGYRHNQIASRLAAKSTRTLGVLLLDLHNTVYADFYDGLVGEVEPDGYHLLLVAGSTDASRQRAGIDGLVKMQVDGIVLAGYTGDAETLRAATGSTPVVVAHRDMTADGFDGVHADDDVGMDAVVAHLAGLGHTRIAHVASPAHLPDARRADSYVRAMRAHGLAPLVVDGDLTERGGQRATVALWSADAPPTAVVAHNDLSAIGVMSELRTRGLHVPDDVSVVGYDNTGLAGVAVIDLTSVDQRAQQQGAVAGRMILERLADPDAPPRATTLEPVLVARATTGRVRA